MPYASVAIFLSSVNPEEMKIHWSEVVDLASSAKQGTVMASLILKKACRQSQTNWTCKSWPH